MKEHPTSVLSERHQRRWKNHHIFDSAVIAGIDDGVQLHRELCNPRSSAAACINTIGSIARNKDDLTAFLNEFDVGVQEIIPFPTGVDVDGEVYNDVGNVVFEWMGPRRSPIGERGGKRGQNRTSIDAFVLAVVNGKVTQLLIEWKFTETYNGGQNLQKFSGIAGNERLRRYSSCLARLRKAKDLPFRMDYEGGIGLHDFGYEPYFQLLRMTLLAKLTTPLSLGDGPTVEDYQIVHMSHSDNSGLNTLSRSHVSLLPGLKQHAGRTLHEVWRSELLSDAEASKFCGGYWDKAIGAISDGDLKDYLLRRYGGSATVGREFQTRN